VIRRVSDSGADAVFECVTTSRYWKQSIGGLVKVEMQRWWGHLTRILWQKLLWYSETELQRGQQLSGSKWAHRGEPANEGADILANKAISDPKPGKEWCQQLNREVLLWKKSCREAREVTYQDRHSTFNTSVRDTLQRGAAEKQCQNIKRNWRVLGDK